MGCEELEQKLNKANTELQSQSLKLTAEIDDLNRTKTNLEERLIELIRYYKKKQTEKETK